jgi:hypothetical protein
LSTGGDVNITGDLFFQTENPFTTLIQTVTQTANRVISFPDATGTVALVGGNTGQLLYNLNGAVAGLATATTNGTDLTLNGRLIIDTNGAASAPPLSLTGTWFTGGTSTTTKPAFLIEPSGTTSTAWSTSGTGLGVNAPSGFTGNLADFQVNGTRQLSIEFNGAIRGFSNQKISPDGPNWSVTGAILGSNYALAGAGAALRVGGTSAIGWNNQASVAGGGVDTTLFRDAADTLAQRRSTNAQTTRIYNTFTSDTNFERAKLEWASNVLRIGTEKGSAGGTARDMVFETDGTERARISADGSVNVVSTNPTGVTGAGQITNIISLTQAEYDAIVAPDAATLYVITD